jgi:hypothetical protein
MTYENQLGGSGRGLIVGIVIEFAWRISEKSINYWISKYAGRDENPGPLEYVTVAQPSRRHVHYRSFGCLEA